MSYPPVIPANLAFNDIIAETWVDSVSNIFASAPWGPVQPPIVITVDQTNIAASASVFTDITNFAITVPVIQGRWYEVMWMVETQQNTATGSVVLQISLEGGTPATALVGTQVLTAAQSNVWSGSYHFYGGTSAPFGGGPYTPPGNRIVKLQIRTTAGTVSIVNGAVMNGRFVIKDIGGW